MNKIEQKLETEVKHSLWRFALASWIAILVLNIAALGAIYVALKNKPPSPKVNLPSPSPTTVNPNWPACKDYLDAAMATLSAVKTQTPKAKLGINEPVYIPLGSLSSKSFGSWSDTGMQTYLDSVDYPAGARVYLEASMRIPTANGQVFLRVVQGNENLVVPGTEISVEGNQPKLITSSGFKLWSGNKLYKLQFRTSMDYEAVVDFARFKIVY